MISHPSYWNHMAVGRWRRTESSLPAAASLQGGLFGVSIHPSFALYGLFKPCTRRRRLYLLHICIYMRASILTAFQAAHSLLRLHETGDKVRDAIPSRNWRIIVGNAAVIVSTIQARKASPWICQMEWTSSLHILPPNIKSPLLNVPGYLWGLSDT